MLRRKGIRVVSITEHADDSSTGKLMETIIESVDEFYSENVVTWDPDDQVWISIGRDGGELQGLFSGMDLQRRVSTGRDGGELQSLFPGMGLWLRVGGDTEFEWSRSRGPYVNRTQLVASGNFVAWQALDGVPAAVGLRQIRDVAMTVQTWDAAQQHWRVAVPAQPTSQWSLEEFNHGDAVWIQADASVEWRQLTGESPRVIFVVNVSAELRERTLADLESIRETFATIFGGVVSGQSVFVFADTDTQIAWRQEVYGSARQRESCGSALAGTVYATLTCGPEVLAHEYFHALQAVSRLSEEAFGGGSVHWMQEGAAQYAAYLWWDRHEPGRFANYMRFARDWFEDDGRPLRSVSSAFGAHHYHGGALAVSMLVEDVGSWAVLDYVRRLQASQPGLIRGESTSERKAFQRAFGITLEEFYTEFEDNRGTLPDRIDPSATRATELVTRESPFRLDLIIEGPNGELHEGFASVLLQSVRGGLVTSNGTVQITMPRGVYDIERVTVDGGCSVPFERVDTDGTPNARKSAVIVSDNLLAQPNRIRVSAGACGGVISGVVRGPGGAPLRRAPAGFDVWVEAYAEGEADRRRAAAVIPDEEGRFKIMLAPGQYSVGISPIESGGAAFGWHTAHGVSTSYSERMIIDVSAESPSEINISLPFAKTVEISGTVRGPSGMPVPDISVSPVSFSHNDRPGWVGWGGSTDTGGHFKVKFRGLHVGLLVSRGDCELGWYGPNGFVDADGERSYFEPKDRDILDLTIDVPKITCE